jgi:uncharacterized protein (DUF1684 family)
MILTKGSMRKINNRIIFLGIFLTSISSGLVAQKKSYIDSLQEYQRAYVEGHEVVGKNDKQYIHFFPIDASYRVLCTFTPSKKAKWFAMKTSGKETQTYRKYGVLSFHIHDTALKLTVYQSQSLMISKEYSDYLFIPFTDNTSGDESYAAGRYIDCKMGEITNNKLLLDFNKAYNPYCAYTSGYNCPIPPSENDLPISIKAGEKIYGKKH